MKAVVRAGGLGPRIKEETAIRAKPMVEIGEKPVCISLELLSFWNQNDVVSALGYVIKELFANYFLQRTVWKAMARRPNHGGARW